MVLRASRSGRHPVKVEIAGSNPVSTAAGLGVILGSPARGAAGEIPDTERRRSTPVERWAPRPGDQWSRSSDWFRAPPRHGGGRPFDPDRDYSSSRGETDITPGYEAGEWGFDSLREYASSASLMGKHCVHTAGTGVRFPC
jgi:hypothetical protein